jgi:hypothetical protein
LLRDGVHQCLNGWIDPEDDGTFGVGHQGQIREVEDF